MEKQTSKPLAWGRNGSPVTWLLYNKHIYIQWPVPTRTQGQKQWVCLKIDKSLSLTNSQTQPMGDDFRP